MKPPGHKLEVFAKSEPGNRSAGTVTPSPAHPNTKCFSQTGRNFPEFRIGRGADAYELILLFGMNLFNTRLL